MKIVKRLRRVVIREEMVIMCGNFSSAMLLDWLISAMYEERAVDGWVSDTSEEIAAALMNCIDKRTVQRHMAALYNQGLVLRKHGERKALIHKPHLEQIVEVLAAYGYGLDGFGWGNTDPEKDNKLPTQEESLPFAKGEPVDGQVPDEGVETDTENPKRQIDVLPNSKRQIVAPKHNLSFNTNPSLVERSSTVLDHANGITKVNTPKHDKRIKDNKYRAGASIGKTPSPMAENPQDKATRGPVVSPPAPAVSPKNPVSVMFQLFTETFGITCNSPTAQVIWADEFEWILGLVGHDAARAMRMYGYAREAMNSGGNGSKYTIAGPQSLHNAVFNLGDPNQTKMVVKYKKSDDPYYFEVEAYVPVLAYP